MGFSEFANPLIDKDHLFNQSTCANILNKKCYAKRINNLKALEKRKPLKSNA